jgi:hypothetical protein
LRNPSAIGRANTLLGHARAGAWQKGLIPEFHLPTQIEAGRFSQLLAAWNAASHLDDDSFHDHFTRGLVDNLATVRRLRQAAASSVQAQTIGQMIEASYPLTTAIKDIGGSRWPSVLDGLQDRATGDGSHSGKIVLAAGAGEREEIDPDPLAELRLADYNNAMAALRRIDPYNPQLETLTGPNYRPDTETIRSLWNEVRLQQEKLAYRMSQGHGFDGPNGHGYQFGRPGKPCTREEYYNKILRVIRDPSVTIVPLKRGRTAFYQDSTNTLVVVDPNSWDRGSMYKPDADRAALSKLE